MQDNIISLADYIHAFELVLKRVTRACPDRHTADACGQALRILDRVESTRMRLGISGVEQAEFARISGQPLPTGVIAWLTASGRRLFAQEFALLAAEVLALCRGLETMVHAHLCCADS